MDPDALDLAIATLDDLRNSGRLVGIVSHVPELKQRITAGITVTKTDRGSSVDLVGVAS